MNDNTINDLAAIGSYLFGSGWQRAMARELQINERTVRRWISGYSTFPPGVWTELVRRAAEKQMQAAFPIIEGIIKERGATEVVDLYVYPDDSKLLTMHHRPWSGAADAEIKRAMVPMLAEHGIAAQVVLK